MELVNVNLVSKIDSIEDGIARDIIFKVAYLAFKGNDIGATKKEIARYFDVNERTIERHLKAFSSELAKYGKILWTPEDFEGDKFVGLNFSPKSRRLVLLNRKHILFLASLLAKQSKVAKRVLNYLIEVEGIATPSQRVSAVEKSMLPSEISLLKSEIQLLKEQFDTVKPMISFAQAVQATDNEISIDDFCKITFEKLGYGRNTLFAELRKRKILNSKNCPQQRYVKNGFFVVKTRDVIGEIKYQPLLTGKGQLWLFDSLNLEV